MVKGAAGQAIQNMNIACGLDETAGPIPPVFLTGCSKQFNKGKRGNNRVY